MKHITAGICTLAVGLLLTQITPASAQDNSLFGGSAARRQPAPTTQPAGGMSVSARMGLDDSVRTTLNEDRPAQQNNGIHLAVSPIAVATPEPEIIGVNDLVTIIVRVTKTAKTKAKMESKKDWKHAWELSKWIRLSDKNGIVPALFTQGVPAVEFDFQNDYGGDGKYDRSDSLTTRVQARVIDVKPNGNLVLEARNDVSFGEEDYTVTLTGVCRSDDVTPENTVLSSQVAELSVQVLDRGAVRDATRRGWLQRGLDLIRPF